MFYHSLQVVESVMNELGSRILPQNMVQFVNPTPVFSLGLTIGM